MGSLTWRCEGTVDAQPDDVYAWLTDFSADDHSSEAYRRGAGIDARKRTKPSSRKVLSREGDVLRIEDTWNGQTWTQTVTLDAAARAIRIEGGMGYAATWRAEPHGSGTRISVEGQMGRGLVGSVMRLFEKRTRRSMQQDFDGHMEALRESLRDAGKLK
ncbi:MAG TPA: SRPBCC family protein [Candidatus Thermoplasmatota archaeon]|nr:SRPBCC family protein [Candidatus Thermoplasmatota archaeon]